MPEPEIPVDPSHVLADGTVVPCYLPMTGSCRI